MYISNIYRREFRPSPNDLLRKSNKDKTPRGVLSFMEQERGAAPSSPHERFLRFSCEKLFLREPFAYCAVDIVGEGTARSLCGGRDRRNPSRVPPLALRRRSQHTVLLSKNGGVIPSTPISSLRI